MSVCTIHLSPYNLTHEKEKVQGGKNHTYQPPCRTEIYYYDSLHGAVFSTIIPCCFLIYYICGAYFIALCPDQVCYHMPSAEQKKCYTHNVNLKKKKTLWISIKAVPLQMCARENTYTYLCRVAHKFTLIKKEKSLCVCVSYTPEWEEKPCKWNSKMS